MRPSLFSLCAPSGRRVGTSFLQPHHTQICRFQTIRGARYIPQYTVSVPAPSKQAALLEETMWAAKPGVRIYTDGSSMAGGVGAAAAMYVPGKAEADILHYHLGPSDQYDMYDADLVGLLLAIELLKRQNASSCMAQGASIALDNRSALLSTQRRTCQPGHYLLDEIHRSVSRLHKKHRHINLTLRWIPGHVGVEGNETADRWAKVAAKGLTSAQHALPASLDLDHLLFIHKCWMFCLPRRSSSARFVPLCT